MAVNAKTIIQNILIGIIVAVALFSSILILSYSVIKIIVIPAILITGLIWLVSRGKIKRVLKFLVLFTMIFAISFASIEAYLFQNAGYPPVPSQPDVTVSMQTMLNASLTEIVRGIEQGPTFSLLRLEHANLIFESIGLNPIGIAGGISVNYFIEDTHSIARFASWDGRQYKVTISRLIGQPFSEKYQSMQTAEETLMQIDSLGLQWFYDQALDLAQNRTVDLPTVDSLSISLTYESYRDYHGITVQLIGSHQTVMPDNTIRGSGILIASFQPDGTLLYMSQQQ
jgi:hypothetical protein